MGRNRVVVAGKEFLLTGTNGAVTKTLEFVYSVKANDKIVAKSRHYDIETIWYLHLKFCLRCKAKCLWQEDRHWL
jgi:hypothetical protein